MECVIKSKPPVKDNAKVSIWLFVNRNNDIGDTIKAFNTKAAAEKYFYEYIGQYVYDCIKEEDVDELKNFIFNLKTAATDNLYLYDSREGGEEFYIEEVEVND